MSILAGNKPINAITGLFANGKRAINNFTDNAAFKLAGAVLDSNYINNKYGLDATMKLGGNILDHRRAVGRAIVGGGAVAGVGAIGAGYGTYKALSD